MLENAEVVTQIASAATLDEAAKLATELMVDRVIEKTGMPVSEATMLMSAVGQVEICQVVDPLMTARFAVPKWLEQQLGVRFI